MEGQRGDKHRKNKKKVLLFLMSLCLSFTDMLSPQVLIYSLMEHVKRQSCLSQNFMPVAHIVDDTSQI